MAVDIDAQCGKAEFKIHYLDLGKSEPPVDSAIIKIQHEILHSLFNNMVEREIHPTIVDE